MTATLTNPELLCSFDGLSLGLPAAPPVPTRAEEVEYVPHESFSDPKAEAELWGPDRPVIHVPHYRPYSEDEDPGPQRRALSPEEERTMFLRYNYAKYRLAKLLRTRPSRRSQGWDGDVRTWARRAEEARCNLVHANLALVPAMARNARTMGVELGDLIAEGNMAVLRSIEKFDLSRGYKFSTYACRSILSAFRQLSMKAQRRRMVFPVEFDPELERSDAIDKRHERQRTDAIEAVREVLSKHHLLLTDLEHRVILERFPVFSDGKRRTLAQIGTEVGLTNERIRQIEKRSLQKLRLALEDHFAA